MSRQKEGAANRQVTRSKARATNRRVPVHSLTETCDGDGLALTWRETVASVAVGFLSLLALMWLAAAF